MTVSRKIISLFLSVILAFSCMTFSASSYDNQAVYSSEGVLNDAVERAEDFFSGIVNALKAAFDKVYNFICGLFGIGYTNLDISQYTENAFAVPGLDTDFVPQGLCYVDELKMFAVSGYMYGKAGESRIYLVNPDTDEFKYVCLKGFYAHAGGIAAKGNDIWVSSGGGLDSDTGKYNYGTVYHLTVDVLENAENGSAVEFDGKFKTEAKGSFAYASEDMLWIGEFYTSGGDNEVNPEHYYGNNHAIVCGYKLPLSVDYSLNAPLVPDVALSVPDKVQGMSTDADGNIYFSASYGRHNNSALYIFDSYSLWDKSSIEIMDLTVDFYSPKDECQLAKIKMPTLMEGIDTENGQLYILFESGAKAYSDADTVIKDVWKTDIKSLLNSIG